MYIADLLKHFKNSFTLVVQHFAMNMMNSTFQDTETVLFEFASGALT